MYTIQVAQIHPTTTPPPPIAFLLYLRSRIKDYFKLNIFVFRLIVFKIKDIIEDMVKTRHVMISLVIHLSES